jgi:hypothetical protein
MKDFDIWDIEYQAASFIPTPTMDQFLDSRYEWQAGANGAEWPYYRFFHCLAAMLQPGLTA